MARILIADDDPGAREMLGRICEFHGHEIEAVADPAKASAALDAFDPALVILDLSMPKGGGRAFLEEMRDAGRTCPVIVVSGYVDAIGESQLRLLGANAVLRKPIEVSTMIAAVDDALGVTEDGSGRS